MVLTPVIAQEVLFLLSTFLFGVLLSLADGIMWVVAYVSNNVFPQPLSAAEEARLLKEMADDNPDARNILVEHNLRLVAHIVKKFDNTGEDSDDLISIGTIGLIKAINTFNPERKTRLATYAARCIENEILMHLRSIKKNRGEVMLHEPIGADKEGNEITLLDILGTDPDLVVGRVEANLENERLRSTLRRLNGREKRILELRYGLLDGIRQTQREISKSLGISRSYVSRIEKRALTKLQQQLSTEG